MVRLTRSIKHLEIASESNSLETRDKPPSRTKTHIHKGQQHPLAVAVWEFIGVCGLAILRLRVHGVGFVVPDPSVLLSRMVWKPCSVAPLTLDGSSPACRGQAAFLKGGAGSDPRSWKPTELRPVGWTQRGGPLPIWAVCALEA